MARNVQQTMALDLLLDDEIKFLTLLGTHGESRDGDHRRRACEPTNQAQAHRSIVAPESY